MPDVYVYQAQAQPGDIDDMQHVNNLVYLRWLQEAAIAHSSAQGWPGERYRQTGAGWVVRSHFIEYLQPVFLGDLVLVQTWVADMQKITSLRKYRIVRPADQTVLARAETNWAYIGIEHGVPRRIPSELRDAFTIVADDPPLTLPELTQS